MTSDDLRHGQRAENDRKWRASRRRLLQLIGAGAVATAAVPVLAALAGKEAVTAAEDAPDADRRVRRWSMVIDLRKCDGCQSQGTPPQCTTACIEGHFVPEPMEWIEIYEHEVVGGGTQFVPTPCMQCQNPPCVNVCPVGATWSTPEGVVLIDQERCIGCRMPGASPRSRPRPSSWITAQSTRYP
jgi:ferredoxin